MKKLFQIGLLMLLFATIVAMPWTSSGAKSGTADQTVTFVQAQPADVIMISPAPMLYQVAPRPGDVEESPIYVYVTSSNQFSVLLLSDVLLAERNKTTIWSAHQRYDRQGGSLTRLDIGETIPGARVMV